jgi:transglutaminase-like putative cysteine protease
VLTLERPRAWPQPATTTTKTQPRRSRRRGNGDNAATLALTVLTLASALGLERVFSGTSWIGATVATAVVMHAVCWATRRVRLHAVLSLVIQLVAVWLIVCWTVIPSSTVYGVPLATSGSQMVDAFRQAHAEFATAIAPVVISVGFKMVAVLGVAVIVVLADWAALRWRSALYGALPAFVYFVATATVSELAGRELIIIVEVAALLVFLLFHHSLVGRADDTWFGNQQAGVGRWAVGAGALAGCAALVAAVAIGPAMAHSEGVGILGWHSGSGPGGAGQRIVANPIVNLQTELIKESTVQAFQVTSPVDTYWRLTSLDNFSGTAEWTATDSYRDFDHRLPGVVAVPPGTRSVTETFSVQNLDLPWLPDAFTPVSVTGVKGVSYDSSSGSLITAKTASNGLHYTVQSYQYLTDLTASDLEAAPPIQITSDLHVDLALPSSVPSEVYKLAKQIVAGQNTEYGKALALQNFFLTPSERFSYNLDPPFDGYGMQALTGFLFDTRQGYCQQFAGSYAVLARAIGLPTRLAIGFAKGTQVGPDTYQVDYAQYHTWPEVWFGKQYGWLPFEPTPSYSNPVSAGYAPQVGNGGSNSSNSTRSNTLQEPREHLPGSGTGASATPTTVAPSTSQPGSSLIPSARHHSANPEWIVLVAVVGVALLWAMAVVIVRRTRHAVQRRRARGSPGAVVQSWWSEVTDVLSWWGAPAHTFETDIEYGRRAAQIVARRLGEPTPWLPQRITRLAALATEATFAADVAPVRAHEAQRLAAEIRKQLFRGASWRLWVRWVLVPSPGRHQHVA